jgi:hypothetical protein
MGQTGARCTPPRRSRRPGFGYKNHISIDRRHRLIQRQAAPVDGDVAHGGLGRYSYAISQACLSAKTAINHRLTGAIFFAFDRNTLRLIHG